MKKFIAFFVVAALLAGAAFYFGWLQFAVPADRLGVMVSKTGGVYPNVIERGVFLWRPERLLPTNAMIVSFSASPSVSTVTVTGELPSGKLYAAWMQVPSSDSRASGQADFSYTATITCALKIKPERLPALYESGAVTDQAALDVFLRQKCTDAARLACDALIARKTVDEAFVAGLSGNPAFFDTEVVRLHVESATVPDPELYERARASYAEYRDRVNDALSILAREHAVSTMKATAAMEQLEKLGILLQSYPLLAELFAKADSPAAVIREINSLFGQ
jgi:hypothetical protein